MSERSSESSAGRPRGAHPPPQGDEPPVVCTCAKDTCAVPKTRGGHPRCCCEDRCTCPRSRSHSRRRHGSPHHCDPAASDEGRWNRSRRCLYCMPERAVIEEAGLLERQQRCQSARAEQRRRYNSLRARQGSEQGCDRSTYRTNTAGLLRSSRGSDYQRAADAEYRSRREELRAELCARRDEIENLRRQNATLRASGRARGGAGARPIRSSSRGGGGGGNKAAPPPRCRESRRCTCGPACRCASRSSSSSSSSAGSSRLWPRGPRWGHPRGPRSSSSPHWGRRELPPPPPPPPHGCGGPCDCSPACHCPPHAHCKVPPPPPHHVPCGMGKMPPPAQWGNRGRCGASAHRPPPPPPHGHCHSSCGCPPPPPPPPCPCPPNNAHCKAPPPPPPPSHGHGPCHGMPPSFMHHTPHGRGSHKGPAPPHCGDRKMPPPPGPHGLHGPRGPREFPHRDGACWRKKSCPGCGHPLLPTEAADVVAILAKKDFYKLSKCPSCGFVVGAPHGQKERGHCGRRAGSPDGERGCPRAHSACSTREAASTASSGLVAPKYGRKVFITDDARLDRRASRMSAWERSGAIRRMPASNRSPSAPLPEKTPKWRIVDASRSLHAEHDDPDN